MQIRSLLLQMNKGVWRVGFHPFCHILVYFSMCTVEPSGEFPKGSKFNCDQIAILMKNLLHTLQQCLILIGRWWLP